MIQKVQIVSLIIVHLKSQKLLTQLLCHRESFTAQKTIVAAAIAVAASTHKPLLYLLHQGLHIQNHV